MYQELSIFQPADCRKEHESRNLLTRFCDDEQLNQSDSSDHYDDTVCDLVIKLVSTLERVLPQELTGNSRGRAEVCLARQMAMYLMHTVFSVPYHRVAEYLKRDRTTVAHACRLVEDLRDNEEFDKRLEAMENLLVSARALCEIADRYRDHD